MWWDANMKPGDLVSAKPGFRTFHVSPCGVIVDETLSTAPPRFWLGDAFRTFHIMFPDGICRMMAYEFEIIGPEKSGEDDYNNQKGDNQMRYYPKSAVGFEINMTVAETLGLLEQWEEWDGEQFDSEFGYEFEEKYGVTPSRVITFEDSRGGEISGLTGFTNGSTYVLFDEDESGEAWDKLVEIIEQSDITLEDGSWSQLG
jgi:hypothetical protein